MLHYLVKRLLGLIPTLFLVAVLVFLFVHMLPGDPARLAAGPEADQTTVELVRKDLGLDKPIPEQFVAYFGKILTKGDFGTSIRTKRPVRDEIGERFAATFWLTVWSMVWSVFFGLVIGMVSATRRNKWQDHAGMALAVSGISFPTFALGLLLMEIFSVGLGWLPTVGADTWKHYILPSITLGAGVAAVMARFMVSAAAPWMGIFSATRSPKERVLKLLALLSGRARRRWNMVSTYPSSRAFCTTPSI